MNWQTLSEQYKDQMLKDLKGLIKIPSLRNDAEKKNLAPFGKGCREALDYMMQLGRKEGFDVQDIDGYACVISYGAQKESIGVLGHLDVVPIGEGWSKEPFDLTNENGILFGRGVLDDKGPSMAGFYALKMIKDANIKLNKKVMLIYGCDEESGMECMNYYVNHAPVPSMGFVPDADFPVIYGEKGILNLKLKIDVDSVCEMQVGERANIVIGKATALCKDWNEKYKELFEFFLKIHQLKGEIVENDKEAQLTIEGAFAHAATPYLGNNAALHMLNFMGTVYKNDTLNKIYNMLKDWQAHPLKIAMEGSHMGFLTMNTGIVSLKDSIIEITVDIRYPHDCDSTAVIEAFKIYMEENKLKGNVIVLENSKPLFVDPNSKLVSTLMNVYQAYSGDTTTKPKTMGGGTYARKLPNFVAFGPEFPRAEKLEGVGAPHQKDEGVPVEDLVKAMAIYAGAIEELAK